MQLKEQQQINRERRMLDEGDRQRKEAQAAQQKARFDHVKSHGYGQAKSGDVDDVEIKVFVNECDDNRRVFSIMESSVTQQQPQSQPTRPQAAIPKPKSSTPSLPPVSSRGVVPDYLLKRKAEMQAEKEAIQRELELKQELSRYPPGHRPVTEEERLDILEKLSDRKKELQADLHRLPVRFDTQAVRQKRLQIENEMAETEAAERKFSSKKQLFVPI